MQTNFTLQQLADPDIAASNAILRACVHCGFCTATCPTYTLLGDELDSPRGRIYQIKNMLERDIPAPAETVKHLDRCLSCLSCMTTCPSGVHYMHLVDHARAHVEKTFTRPLMDRSIRRLLSLVLPRPLIFRLALIGASFAKPFAQFLPGTMGAMFRWRRSRLRRRASRRQTAVSRKATSRACRLMNGCAQKVLAPKINATICILTRHGIEVVVAGGRVAAARWFITWAVRTIVIIRRRGTSGLGRGNRQRTVLMLSLSTPVDAGPRSRTTALCFERTRR